MKFTILAFFFFWPQHAACGISIPQPEIEPAPPAVKRGVLTTGLPGKFPILAILKRGVQHEAWHEGHSHCFAAMTSSHLQDSSSCQTDSLYPLNNSHPLTSQPLEMTILLSVSMILTTLYLYKWNHTVLSFCDWLISLSTMSAVFIHVVACVRISFLYIIRLNDIPSYVHTTSCSVVCLLVYTCVASTSWLL